MNAETMVNVFFWLIILVIMFFFREGTLWGRSPPKEIPKNQKIALELIKIKELIEVHFGDLYLQKFLGIVNRPDWEGLQKIIGSQLSRIYASSPSPPLPLETSNRKRPARNGL